MKPLLLQILVINFISWNNYSQVGEQHEYFSSWLMIFLWKAFCWCHSVLLIYTNIFNCFVSFQHIFRMFLIEFVNPNMQTTQSKCQQSIGNAGRWTRYTKSKAQHTHRTSGKVCVREREKKKKPQTHKLSPSLTFCHKY